MQIISTTDRKLPWHTALPTFFPVLLYFYEPLMSELVSPRSSIKERIRAQPSISQIATQNHWGYTRISWLLLQKGTFLSQGLCNPHLPMWTFQRLQSLGSQVALAISMGAAESSPETSSGYSDTTLKSSPESSSLTSALALSCLTGPKIGQ